jgi:hypothetical protein
MKVFTNSVNKLLRLPAGTLAGAMEAVWLRQPESARVRAPAPLRHEARAQLLRARELLRAARGSPSGPERDELSAAALHALLAVVGRAADPAAEDVAALRTGRERVKSTLRDESLLAALSRSTESGVAPALTEPAFRVEVALCEWVDALVDNRSERERRLSRRAPWAALAVALAFVLHAIFGNRNLALGKRVTASSTCSLTPPRRYNEPELSRVVDGVYYEGPAVNSEWKDTAFAVCTESAVHSWINVDLGAERKLSRAVVYGRSDCCWGDGLPVSLEVSSDDKHFVTIDTTETPFTAAFPWKIALDGRRARYVRLYAKSRAATSLVVSEIEVYGR